MRVRVSLVCLLACLPVIALLPGGVRAQSVHPSVVWLSHATVAPGQAQTVSVYARDLAGNPFTGASGTAVVHYGTRALVYHFPRTDAHGFTEVTFRPPGWYKSGKASVQIVLTNGYLAISLTSSFTLRPLPARQSPPGTPGASILQLDVRALPAVVSSPAPEWIIIHARTAGGRDQAGATVTIAVMFAGHPLHLQGKTDSHGIATVRVDTAGATSDQTVAVGVVVHAGGAVGSTATQFDVGAGSPTATPTDTPTLTPTPTDTPNPLPIYVQPAPPTDTPVPTATPTDTPIPTLPPAPTATPTATTVPAASPTPTSTPVPTDTLTPTDTPTPTETATPSPTATPDPQCTRLTLNTACRYYMLSLLNQDRTSANLQYPGMGARALSLSLKQSNGTSSCAGSEGHSQAMADSGDIWHQDPNDPNSPASFPNNLCVNYMTAGENVGRWDISQFSVPDALQKMDQMMMAEGYSPGCQGTHACNIVSPGYNQVGIGIVIEGSMVYLTEDFIG